MLALKMECPVTCISGFSVQRFQMQGPDTCSSVTEIVTEFEFTEFIVICYTTVKLTACFRI